MELIADYLTAAAAWTARNSLAASVLAGAVLLISRLMGHRLHSNLIALLWVLVGIRLILPAAPASSFSVFHFVPSFAVVEAGSHSVEAPMGAESAVALSPVVVEAGERHRTAPKIPVAPSIGFDWLSILAAIWAAVAAGLIFHTLLRQRRLARVIGELPAVTDPNLRRLLVQCTKSSGVPVRFRFVTAPAGSGVAVFGFLRVSHLIIPADFADRYTAAEMKGILLHELAHIRRHDLLWNWVTLGIQCAHWFNPLVWIAGRRFLAVREALCDRDAVSRLQTNERRTYGAALIKALESGRPTSHSLPHPAMAPFFSQSSEIKNRITMIIKPQSTPMSIQLAAIALVAVAGLATFTTASMAEEEGRKREGESPRGSESERSERPERSREGETQRKEGERSTSRESARDGEKSARESEGGRSVSENGPLRVTIRRDGVTLGGKIVPLVNVRRELEGTAAKSAVLAADSGVSYQTVETVVTALKSAGIEEIAFGAAGGESGNARDGARDGEGARSGPRDGEMKREGAGDGESPRSGPRDGEGASKSGPRDRDVPRSGPRDGEGSAKSGPRDGDVPRSGPREGDAPQSGSREGEGDRPSSPRDVETSGMDERKLQQATRIYRAHDKDGDGSVTFEEWLAMKSGEITPDRKATEKGWFDQADASRDGKITLGEWIDWQANRGRDRG